MKSPLSVPLAAKYLVNNSKVQLGIHVRSVVYIKNLENKSIELGRDCLTSDLRDLSFSQVARDFVEAVHQIQAEKLDKIEQGQTTLSQISDVDESELESLQALLPACALLDKFKTGSQNLSDEEVRSIARSICELPEENPTLYDVQFWNGLDGDFTSNKKLFREFIKINPTTLAFVTGNLKEDKGLAMLAVKKDGLALEHASSSIRGYKPVLFAAIKQNSNALQFATDPLRNNKKVIEYAFRQDGFTLEYASDNLRDDKEMVRFALTEESFALKYASPRLQADEELVIFAISKEGCALEFASPDLRASKKIVMIAVKQDGCALQYASANLRADKKVVLAAIKKSAKAFFHASDALKQDQDVIDFVLSSENLDDAVRSDVLKHIKARKAEVAFDEESSLDDFAAAGGGEEARAAKRSKTEAEGGQDMFDFIDLEAFGQSQGGTDELHFD